MAEAELDLMSATSDPVLRLVMTLRVECTAFETVGDMGKGMRRLMTLTGGSFEISAQIGGTFSTPAVKGTVLGGYDWQILHSERLAELDARYNLRTENGHLIYVRAKGRRYASPENLKKLLRGEPVERGPDYYGASTPIIETGAPDLLWMNHHAFIGNSRSESKAQHLSFFVVDYGNRVDLKRRENGSRAGCK
jgi:hypothetical protein